MVKVLFICMGNICRSPMAEGILSALAEQTGLDRASPPLVVDSAGTSEYHVGEPPDPRAVRTAAEYGLSIGHLRARKVTQEDLERFDYLIAMERANIAHMAARLGRSRVEQAAERTRLLLSFAPDVPLDEVPDPYYGGEEDFHRCFDLLERGVAGLFAHIAHNCYEGRVSLDSLG